MSASLKTRARHVQRKEFRPEDTILRLVGTGLLWATAGVHLDLYLTGYRTIPTIGWLFLLQVIAGLGLGLLLLVTGNRLVSAAGALFALSTLGGYLLSVQFGLFGFREVRTTAGIVAGIIEVAAFAVLAVYALLRSRSPGARVPGLMVRMPSLRIGQACLGAAAVAVVALGLLGAALASASAPAATTASGSLLGTANISGTTVLTNSKGLTLYWFAPDTSTRSACNGTCAQYWPPVPGPVHAGAGVAGTFGTIRRSDGSIQATYNGHPLYTYIGDSGRGQAHGNNLDLNGGYWHEVVVSG
jgi:predicted lipoprotein with Yx(FWY)xxD motif